MGPNKYTRTVEVVREVWERTGGSTVSNRNPSREIHGVSGE
jgi:hypothetical protein